MTVTLEMTAFQIPEDEVAIALGVENQSTEDIRVGTMMSQLYELDVHSETVAKFGESHGYMAAPHHLTIPAGKSKVFIRTYRSTHPANEVEHIDASEWQFSALHMDVSERVTAEGTVFIRDDGIPNLEETIQFTPSTLTEEKVDEAVESLVDCPETENEIQMG